MSAHLSDSAIYGHLWGTDETRAMLCDEGASAQAQGGSRCASILPWVVRAARALSHFTARFRAKLLYSGQAFRAFALAGVNMARGGVAAARLEHSPL